MVEKEIQREREVETSALTHYDKSTQELREVNRRAKEGKKVLRAKSIPYEVNRQGVVKNYFKGDLTDICNDRWTIFCHEIRRHSGKHIHQGGMNLFVIKGEGYTSDGVGAFREQKETFSLWNEKEQNK